MPLRSELQRRLSELFDGHKGRQAARRYCDWVFEPYWLYVRAIVDKVLRQGTLDSHDDKS